MTEEKWKSPTGHPISSSETDKTELKPCPEGLECSGDGSDCVGEYRCVKEPETVSSEDLKIYIADNVETLLSDACTKIRQWQTDHPCRAQVITAKDSVDYWLLCSLIDHLRAQHPNGIKWRV